MLWLLLFAILFVVYTLPPLFLALMIGAVLALIGWPRRRLLLSMLTLLLLSLGGEAWLTYWLRTPTTPDLTREQATEILWFRPEFRSQGHSPSFQQVQRSGDNSMDYLCEGTFSFVKHNGEQVNEAYAEFHFLQGRWTFYSYHWGPPSMTNCMSLGSTEPKVVRPPCNQIVPGVSWRRLPDGTYIQQGP